MATSSYVVMLVVIAAVAIAAIVYAEQAGAHTLRMHAASLVAPSSGDTSGGADVPGESLEAGNFAPAQYPTDPADDIPTPASGEGGERRGLTIDTLLIGAPTAPRARPAAARGAAVPRHAADLTGRQHVPVPAQVDLVA